jgi:hypothetical protein
MKLLEIIKCILISKTLFIIPTDAHFYKIVEMLKNNLKL